MIGVFGDVDRVRSLGVEVGEVFRGASTLGEFVKGVTPLIWVPKASSLSEGVEDAYGRRYLFAFGNSGCIANPGVVDRLLSAIERLGSLGFKKVLLDAARLPSPIDGLFFVSTCFCSHSLGLCPSLASVRSVVKRLLHGASLSELLELLEELAEARATHVDYILARARDKARELGVELVAAVFPYPLSKLVGQDPKVLRRYLREVHVMLYHRCPTAACLNAELRSLVEVAKLLGIPLDQARELVKRVAGLELSVSEIENLDKGIDLKHVERLANLNREVYGSAFVPILWLDSDTEGRIREFAEKFGRIDVFAPRKG